MEIIKKCKISRYDETIKEEIDAVLEECKSGDHDHTLQTLISYCK